MRLGYEGLRSKVTYQFKCDPLSGHLFVFFNKPKNKCKILFYDQGGLCLFCKRLEVGTFSIPNLSLTESRIEIDRVQFIVIGYDVTEVLEKRPDPYFVNRIIRKKYACSKHPELGVAQAPVPARFIPKGNTGNTVIVEVIASKYIYHLPLVRQEKIFKRLDIPISPSTMVGWIEEFTSRAMPIVDELQKRMRRGGIAYSDDTSIPVMMDSKPERCRTSSRSEGAVAFDRP